MSPFRGPTNPVKSTWQLTRSLQQPGLSDRAYHCRELQNDLPKGTCMGHKNGNWMHLVAPLLTAV